MFLIVDFPIPVPQTVIWVPSPSFPYSITPLVYPRQWSYPLQSLFHTRLTLPRTPDSDLTPFRVFSILDLPFHVPQTVILPPSESFPYSTYPSTYPRQWSYPPHSLFHSRLTLSRTADSDTTPLIVFFIFDYPIHVPQTVILPPSIVTTYRRQWYYPPNSLFQNRLFHPRTADSLTTPLHSRHVPQTVSLPP